MPLCVRACIGRSHAGVPSSRCPADLIDWPEGTRPKRGHVTKTALHKLKVSVLRQELEKRRVKPKGNKEDLVRSLEEALQTQLQHERLVQHPSSHHPHSIEVQERSLDASDLKSLGYRQWPPDLMPAASNAVWIDGDIPDGVDERELTAWLYKNATRLQMMFLGTSMEVPTRDRQLPSVAVRTASDIWIFDAGEDTQRQCMKHPLIKPGRISRIFLTSLDNDVLLGLPGLLCMIAYSRYEGTNASHQPVHVYGPHGTAHIMTPFIDLSDTRLEMPVVIHEFKLEPSTKTPYTIDNRSKMWKVVVTPDGLHKGGYFDARLDAGPGMTRSNRRKIEMLGRKLNSVDDRAGYRPLPLPPKGHSNRYPLPLKDVEWTLKISQEYLVKVRPMNNTSNRLGYRIVEADRAGKLDIERARAYGIVEGEDYGILKEGGSVMNDKGEIIKSRTVVGPDTLGRSIVISGMPIDAIPHVSFIKDADYVIAPMPSDPSRAIAVARDWDVGHLIFSRCQASSDGGRKMLVCSTGDEDRRVTQAFDLYTHVVGRH